MAVTAKPRRRYPKLVFGETLTVAIETFRVSKVRFILTSLGMVIGTASLILVVTIGLTGKQYLLQQIQNIGSNMMVAEYADACNIIGDVETVRHKVGVLRHHCDEGDRDFEQIEVTALIGVADDAGPTPSCVRPRRSMAPASMRS